MKAGQILGRLDSTDAAAAVSAAEANLKTAQANLEQTLTGETAQQRAADALWSASRARRSRRRRPRSQRPAASRSRTTPLRSPPVAQAQRQLRTDLGNERAAVAQLKTDLGTNTNLAAAQAAVTAAQAVVDGDQVRQHTDQVQQGSLQTLQTQWNVVIVDRQAGAVRCPGGR